MLPMRVIGLPKAFLLATGLALLGACVTTGPTPASGPAAAGESKSRQSAADASPTGALEVRSEGPLGVETRQSRCPPGAAATSPTGKVALHAKAGVEREVPGSATGKPRTKVVTGTECD